MFITKKSPRRDSLLAGLSFSVRLIQRKEKKQTYTTASALSKTINDDWAQEALLAVEVESYLKKKSCKNRL